jgi:hypothetical protein
MTINATNLIVPLIILSILPFLSHHDSTLAMIGDQMGRYTDFGEYWAKHQPASLAGSQAYWTTFPSASANPVFSGVSTPPSQIAEAKSGRLPA